MSPFFQTTELNCPSQRDRGKRCRGHVLRGPSRYSRLGISHKTSAKGDDWTISSSRGGQPGNWQGPPPVAPLQPPRKPPSFAATGSISINVSGGYRSRPLLNYAFGRSGVDKQPRRRSKNYTTQSDSTFAKSARPPRSTQR